jgi:hypothetical protein
MPRFRRTRWFLLRVTFALGVLGLLIYDLALGLHRFVVVLQGVLILGIIVTSILGLRADRQR